MGNHLAISGGLLQAPFNPLKTDVSRGPPGLSGGPGPTVIRPVTLAHIARESWGSTRDNSTP